MRFEGSGNGRSPVFETDGPWMLDWRIKSESLLPTNFEMRLHDGTGEFIGTIVQLEGVGSGLKLFEQAGAHQIVVVASNVAWQLEISDVSAEKAAVIKRRSQGRETLTDTSQQALRRVREDSFSTWRAQGSDTLLLFDSDGLGFRATFSAPCHGLESATAISFVTPAAGGMDEYDSILLDDGTRCYFDRVVATRLK